MATKSPYEGTLHVIEISTNVGKGCEHCTEFFDADRLSQSINHYLEAHGYKLLHVGTQTTVDMHGNPYHTTVAVVGK